MAQIKKTMVEALEFVTKHGNMSKENLELFTEKFCFKSGGARSGEPRDSVKLWSLDGTCVARKCSATHKWLLAGEFNGDVEKSSISREANKAKNHNLAESKKVLVEAEQVRLAAKQMESVEDMLAAYDKYDEMLNEAKAIKTQPVDVDYGDTVNFTEKEDMVAYLAESGIEAVDVKPAKDGE